MLNMQVGKTGTEYVQAVAGHVEMRTRCEQKGAWQGSHSHGKKSCHGKWAEKIKSWKLKNILKMSWNFFTADHESRTGSSDNSISTGLLCTVIRLLEAFGLCSRFPIRNVRWEANQLFDSLFSVWKES